MAIAVMFAWGLCVCNYYQLLFGTGTRAPAPFEPDSTIEQKEALMKYWKFGSAVSSLDIAVFATRRTFRKVVQIAIILVTVLSALKIFIVAFQCPRTPWYAFSPAILEHRGAGHCFDLRVVFYWQAAWNLGTDVVILLLPMPVLFSIRMETTKRFSVVAVFAARSPNYYYEGHNGQAMPPFAALRPCVHRGSISLLEAPTRAHVTHTANIYGKLQRNVFIIQNLENISRTRMHAFATPSAPSHLIPSPSQRPENLREGD
ncbi:integral membrane protein [Stemphylium lycopersici]|nr:integral membrane protein [Stemphylium lycopersici]